MMIEAFDTATAGRLPRRPMMTPVRRGAAVPNSRFLQRRWFGPDESRCGACALGPSGAGWCWRDGRCHKGDERAQGGGGAREMSDLPAVAHAGPVAGRCEDGPALLVGVNGNADQHADDERCEEQDECGQ